MESKRLLRTLLLATVPTLAIMLVTNERMSQDMRVAEHNQSIIVSNLYTTQSHVNVTDMELSAQPAPPGDNPAEPRHLRNAEGPMRGMAMLEQKLVMTVKTHKLFDVLLVGSFLALFCLMECGERRPAQATDQMEHHQPPMNMTSKQGDVAIAPACKTLCPNRNGHPTATRCSCFLLVRLAVQQAMRKSRPHVQPKHCGAEQHAMGTS